ncbi:MAG: hypothetical protein M1812_001192 [Candelaria pacifica]|nr:MAG: hypothetical protein M1812_001192 [Candelaria pacifica]
MAQKAAKQTARRNASILNRAHLITFGIHTLFIVLRLLIFQSSATRTTYVLYILLSSPSLFIEFWFERIGRPTYNNQGTSAAELRKSGEDLEAKGLTEYMWDVLYWTWGCVAVAALFGDKAWYMWLVIPIYSAWLAYTTFGGMRQGMAGLAGTENGVQPGAQGGSNRQKKLEKRGGQKVQYR